MVALQFIDVPPQGLDSRAGDDFIARVLVTVLLDRLKVDLLVVAGTLGVSEFVVEDDLAIYALFVPAERRRSELDDFPAAEPIADRAPSPSGDVMCLIDEEMLASGGELRNGVGVGRL